MIPNEDVEPLMTTSDAIEKVRGAITSDNTVKIRDKVMLDQEEREELASWLRIKGREECPCPCTNSNDPGQPGSRYTLPEPPEEKPMDLKDVRSLIANDSFAISFQSLGQYRTYLLKFIDEMIAKHHEMNNCDSTESSLSD